MELNMSAETVFGVLMTAFGALSSCVIYFYKRQEKTHDVTTATLSGKLEDCEKQHEKAGKKVLDLEVRVARMETETDIHKRIQAMEKNVIDAVKGQA